MQAKLDITREDADKIDWTGAHIEGRRWFDKRWGNTYHTVRIYKNGVLLYQSAMCYGYDQAYLQTACEKLESLGILSPLFRQAPSWMRLQTLKMSYSATDVSRKRDLF